MKRLFHSPFSSFMKFLLHLCLVLALITHTPNFFFQTFISKILQHIPFVASVQLLVDAAVEECYSWLARHPNHCGSLVQHCLHRSPLTFPFSSFPLAKQLAREFFSARLSGSNTVKAASTQVIAYVSLLVTFDGSATRPNPFAVASGFSTRVQSGFSSPFSTEASDILCLIHGFATTTASQDFLPIISASFIAPSSAIYYQTTDCTVPH